MERAAQTAALAWHILDVEERVAHDDECSGHGVSPAECQRDARRAWLRTYRLLNIHGTIATKMGHVVSLGPTL